MNVMTSACMYMCIHARMATCTHACEYACMHPQGSVMKQVFAYVLGPSETKMRSGMSCRVLLVWQSGREKNHMVAQIMGNYIMKSSKF